MPFLIEPVLSEGARIAVGLMFVFAIDVFELVRTRFTCWSFKSREVCFVTGFTALD